jgi:hypothetical protein
MQGARRWQPTPIILATGEAEIGGSQFEASPTSKIPNTKQGWWNGSSGKAPEFKPQYCDPLPKKKDNARNSFINVGVGKEECLHYRLFNDSRL